MSTDLYGVRVLRSSPQQKELTLKVIVIYYHVAKKYYMPLPTDYSFFLRVLMNTASEKDAIKQEISIDNICNEAWVNKNTSQFIAKVHQTNKLNDNIKSYKGYSDFYHVQAGGNWLQEEKLVQATYTIQVSDGKYIEHLTEGMTWDTTAYDTNSSNTPKIPYTHQSDHLNDFAPDLSSSLYTLIPFNHSDDGDIELTDFSFSPDGAVLFAYGEQFNLASRERTYFLIAYNTQTWTEESRIKINKEDRKNIIPYKTYAIWAPYKIQMIWKDAAEATLPKAKKVDYISSSKQYIMSAHGKYLQLYDLEGNKTIQIPQKKKSTHATFSPQEQYIALGGEHNQVYVYDLTTHEELACISIPQTKATRKRTRSCAFDSTGNYLMVVSNDQKKIFIYDWQQGELVFFYDSQGSDYIEKATWSPDGAYIAVQSTYNNYYTSPNPSGPAGYIQIFKNK
ncbi:hypothetical protein [Aureispira sp. CCB-E]|uniref:WD40 repeat domain-containing protein n=1 Tax=Aureispira sp. CCB-E TaxID=3051121 RepID=UPI002868868F|nr:hypothetical protein [Aureispira sp. CCB-E]WMX15672.1 hypothetical protein QP953_04665 [Aureispira sp. CCB-E]